MSAIRSRGNATTEKRMIKILREYGIFGWRRQADLLGRPDFVFLDNRLAIFVDGCYWHGCPRCYRAPDDNANYWSEKVARNRARDQSVTRKLRLSGWRVLRFWEHSLRAEDTVAHRIMRALHERPHPIQGRR